MSSFVWAVAGFVMVLGILVTAHEFGHFWVARRVGVKVLRFSIGFGKPIVTWKRKGDETQYVIAAVPLGGYVKMLDETEAEVPVDQLPFAFNRKSLARRSAVVAAGPLANFALALFVYWIMFMVGLPGMRPIVAETEPGSAADKAGLKPFDLITEVGGRPVVTWDDAGLQLLDAVLGVGQTQLTARNDSGIERHLVLDLRQSEFDPNAPNVLRQIGIVALQPEFEAIIGEVVAGDRADLAGLRDGDRLLYADGEVIFGWQSWVKYVRKRPEQTIALIVARGGEEVLLRVTPAKKTHNGEAIGYVGARPAMSESALDRVWTVRKYGPIEAGYSAAREVLEVSVLTVNLIGRIFTGQASVEGIGGPLAIAEFAGASARAGFTQFLSFLAFVSISLGVLNLLPIPVLDGGHLLYYVVEAIKGSPLSERIRSAGQQGGMMFLLGLMALALYNDIVRLLR